MLVEIIISRQGAGFAFTVVQRGHLIATGWLLRDDADHAWARRAVEALVEALGYEVR